MAKLSKTREKVLREIDASGGTQLRYIARRFRITRGSVNSSAQWLRRSGMVVYEGYWRITPAGRAALSQEGE